MNGNQVKRLVRCTGIAGKYEVHTGGLFGMPEVILVTDYIMARELVRAIRNRAMEC